MLYNADIRLALEASKKATPLAMDAREEGSIAARAFIPAMRRRRHKPNGHSTEAGFLPAKLKGTVRRNRNTR